ncbi:MAG: RNA-binding protein [Planctomycetes bacterium]|nr:RNA-binding protein [Planctomycetota bacterium]
MNKKLHVGNLASNTTAAALTERFARDGRKVAKVSLVMSRDPGRSRGFAFVEMETDADASAALAALDGAEIDGRAMKVSTAHPPRSRFGGRVAAHG